MLWLKIRRPVWFAISAYYHWLDMLEGARCRSDGLKHTDPPCEYCRRCKPYEEAARRAYRRGAGLN